jgi:hypothetical protein
METAFYQVFHFDVKGYDLLVTPDSYFDSSGLSRYDAHLRHENRPLTCNKQKIKINKHEMRTHHSANPASLSDN